jgi:hypothetical protein
MGGSSPAFYSTNNGQALLSNPANVQAFLAAIQRASANPAQQAAAQPTAGAQPASAAPRAGERGVTGAGMSSPSMTMPGGPAGTVGGGAGNANFGEGADRVNALANANVAVSPSAMSAAKLGLEFATGGADIPLALAGMAAASALGLGGPFDVAGPSLSADQIAALKAEGMSVLAMTHSWPAAQTAMLQSLAQMRAAALSAASATTQPGAVASGPPGSAIGGNMGTAATGNLATGAGTPAPGAIAAGRGGGGMASGGGAGNLGGPAGPGGSQGAPGGTQSGGGMM